MSVAALTDAPEPTGQVGPVDEPEPAEAAADAPPVARVATRRRTHVRRGLLAAAGVLVVALSVSAFALVGPAPANADQKFVDAARSQGHVVASGDQEALLVSAAHKICDRREDHSTVALRRATALSPEELGAVEQTFTTDVRGFTALALETYCPN